MTSTGTEILPYDGPPPGWAVDPCNLLSLCIAIASVVLVLWTRGPR